MKLTTANIEYIQEDIARRGITIVGLQDNLTDHICCLLENNPTEDFHAAYEKVIRQFYSHDLHELENETLTLLKFKNYHAMKNMMIASGTISAFLMIIGIWFKVMHFPGAALLLPLGILSGSFIFMPLLFTLKAKEKTSVKEKVALVTGGLSILLIGVAFLIRLWGTPAIISLPLYLYYLSAVIALGVSLPFYLSSGLKNPLTKTNTIITALLIIIGYAVFFSMTYNPRHAPGYRSLQTDDYVRSQQILDRERNLAKTSTAANATADITLADKIDKTCEQVKMLVLEAETGHKTIDEGFTRENILLYDHSINLNQPFYPALEKLRILVSQYNNALNAKMDKVPLNSTVLQQGEHQMEHF